MSSHNLCTDRHTPEVCKFVNKIIRDDNINILKQLPDESIDVVVEDPPYGIDFETHYRKKSPLITSNGIKNDDAQTDSMLDEHFRVIFQKMKPNSHLYTFSSWKTAGKHSHILEKHGFDVKNHIIWRKNNWGMGDLKGTYANQYEVIIFAQKGRKELNCLPNDDGYVTTTGKTETCRHPDILEFSRPHNDASLLHHHQKPEELIEFLIKKSSHQGDIVFDGFLGSGTTAIASQKNDRYWIGTEIDEKIVDIAKERLQIEI